MADFLKMPLPAPWSQLNARPVTNNAAKTKGGLFIAMAATGATVGKAPATKGAEQQKRTYVLPMPKMGGLADG